MCLCYSYQPEFVRELNAELLNIFTAKKSILQMKDWNKSSDRYYSKCSWMQKLRMKILQCNFPSFILQWKALKSKEMGFEISVADFVYSLHLFTTRGRRKEETEFNSPLPVEFFFISNIYWEHPFNYHETKCRKCQYQISKYKMEKQFSFLFSCDVISA